jgi:hypothetical protein
VDDDLAMYEHDSEVSHESKRNPVRLCVSQDMEKRFSRPRPFVIMPAEFDGSQARSRPSDIPAMDSSMSP